MSALVRHLIFIYNHVSINEFFLQTNNNITSTYHFGISFPACHRTNLAHGQCPEILIEKLLNTCVSYVTEYVTYSNLKQLSS